MKMKENDGFKTLYDCLKEGDDYLYSNPSDINKAFSAYESGILIASEPIERIALIDHFLELGQSLKNNRDIKKKCYDHSKFLIEKLGEKRNHNISYDDFCNRYPLLDELIKPTKEIIIDVRVNKLFKLLNNIGIKQKYVVQGKEIKSESLESENLAVLLKNCLEEGIVSVSENGKKPIMILNSHLDSLSRGHMPNFYK